MNILSTMVAGSSSGNNLLKTHQVTEDTTIDLRAETNTLILKSDGEYITSINNPISEMQDVLVKNDSLFTITIEMSNRTTTLAIGQVVRLIPTIVDGGFVWYVSGATEADFGLYVPPPPITEYKILTSDAQASDTFGYSVSMSSDGTRCIVGAIYEDTGGSKAGAAYIFFWNGTTWIEEQKIQASDAQASDQFGVSVSMSSDGTRCIVGAHYEDTGSSNAGAAYIFFWNGTTWTEEQKIQASDVGSGHFGYSVSMSSDGTRCIVGAHYESNAGAAYIFSRIGTTWTEEQKIQASDVQTSDHFGHSVSMSSDGTRCIVGAYLEDTGGANTGAAYIFSRSGTTWTEEQKIQASDAQASDSFGYSVSMSSDGTRCIVGAIYEDTGGSNAGAAYIFSRSGTTWIEEQKIQTSDVEANDQIGHSVSMSSDGTRCIVGAHYESNAGGSNAGAAYIFSRSGTTWTEEQKIQASDAEAYDYFGYSVSMSSDGTECIVGAYGEDTVGASAGAAYIYNNI